MLAALLAGWIAGRWPLLQRDVQLAVAQAESAQQLPMTWRKSGQGCGNLA